MEIIKVYNKITLEEKEAVLTYDSIDKIWTMYSTIPKIFRKALKQGWTPIKEYIYDDGTICAMMLTGPERAVTIRSTTKKQMSEKQLSNLLPDDEE